MGYSLRYGRKIWRVLAAALVLFALCCGSALAAPIAVYLDGHEIPGDIAPIARNGRTLAPLRTVSQALGATVMWQDGEASIKTPAGDKLRFKPGQKTFVLETADGARETRTLDVPAVMSNDRVFVPLRVIAETFDVKTDFQDGNVLLSSTPQYVDGQPLTTLAVYQKMTMGGYWTAYYGNASIGQIYRLIQGLRQQEVPAPTADAAELAQNSAPYIGDNYCLWQEYRFYNGKAQINGQGQAEPGMANYLVYDCMGHFDDSRDLLYDMEQDKWYQASHKSWFDFWWARSNMNMPSEEVYQDYA